MLRGRPVVVSVFLWFVSLPVLMHTYDPRLCSKEIIMVVEKLNRTTQAEQNQMDSRLYTPTPENYTQSCPVSTMDCFSQETSVLLQEWNMESHQLITMLQMITERLEKKATTLNSTCSRACELHAQEEVQTFLRSLRDVLNTMNSQFCAISGDKQSARRLKGPGLSLQTSANHAK